MKKFRYGIIGCGAAGKVQAFHFSKHPSVNPVFCVDSDFRQASEFKKIFGFPSAYDDLERALVSEKIDILSIATPPVFHAEQITVGAARGVHILCEKPLLVRPEEADPVLKTCRNMGVRLGVMLPRRFYDNTLTTWKALREKRLGEIQEVRLRLDVQKDRSYYDCWRGRKAYAGGGVLMSQAIHSIDQLVFLFGQAIGVSGRVWTVRDFIDVEDEAEAVIRFPDNIEVSLRATTNSRNYSWRGITEIQGSRGRIVLNSERTPVWDVPETERPLEEEPEEIPLSLKPSYFGPGHKKVIENFIASLEGCESLQTPGEEALGALKIVWQLYGTDPDSHLPSKR